MAFFLSYLSIALVVVVAPLDLINGEIITSPPATVWGVWDEDFERCPEGTYAQGFQLKVENRQFIPGVDDTALNGIRLFCGNPSDGGVPSITSLEGNWGKWGKKFRCNDQGHIFGFQLRVEKASLIPKDETATNNVRFVCTKNNPAVVEGDGLSFGDWQEPRECSGEKVICGIKTQVQPDRGNLLDDTALNNVAFECCDLQS